MTEYLPLKTEFHESNRIGPQIFTYYVITYYSSRDIQLRKYPKGVKHVRIHTF